MLTMPDSAIQVSSSSIQDLLYEAGRSDEILLYIEDDELARLLWERIGNADIIEEAPQIEEDFYLVGLRKHEGAAAGHPKIDDVVVYRCVMAKGVWL